MKEENVLLGPPPVLTIIPTSPALIPAGVIQFIVVLPTTLKDFAFNPPNVTALAFVKLAPVIMTRVPPSVLPNDFEIQIQTEKQDQTRRACGRFRIVSLVSTQRGFS